MRKSTVAPRACSGLMYGTVPTIMPVAVSVTSMSAAGIPSRVPTSASPKSRIFTRPSLVTITFSGLKSRWTMPA